MSIVSVRDLSFGFGDVPVLSGVSFDVPRGEFLTIVGPNGAGKTTLLRLILGMLRPDGGSITVDGEPVSRLTRRGAARKMALVAQRAESTFAFPVRQIVAMGRTPYLGRFQPAAERDRRIVEEALETTETASLADRPLTELSGGERQRVYLARALAQATPLLILDEPTLNLDLFHELQFLEHVRRRTAEGLSVIAVLHDLNLAARYSDRIVVLNGGTVAAVGAPREVITPKLMAEVFHVTATTQFDEATGRLLVSTSGIL